MGIGEIFRERLKQALNDSGLTQVQLAQRTGLLPQSINKYVSGERLPGLESLALMAQALGKPPSFFCGPDEVAFPLSKQALYDLMARVFHEALRENLQYAGLSRASAEHLQQTVTRFGGWDAVLLHLEEELACRELGEASFLEAKREIYRRIKAERMSRPVRSKKEG